MFKVSLFAVGQTNNLRNSLLTISSNHLRVLQGIHIISKELEVELVGGDLNII